MANTKTKRAATSVSKSGGKATDQPQSNLSNKSELSTEGLEKFFHDQLKDIYWAEKHLTKALPKMEKAATSEELQGAFDDHLAQTEEHVVRLEQIFEMLGKKPQAKKCDGMEGLVKEGESAIEETEDGSMTRDAAIIMAAQKVEHYEIASYGTLVQLAMIMGQDKVAAILNATLEEEKDTDKKLTILAESCINYQAEEESEEGEGENTEQR